MTEQPREARPSRLLTAEELAWFLNKEPATVRNWSKNEGPTVTRIGARSVRYDPDHVVDWMGGNTSIYEYAQALLDLEAQGVKRSEMKKERLSELFGRADTSIGETLAARSETIGIRELAEVIGRSERAIRDWANVGISPPFTEVNGRKRFNENDVDEWIWAVAGEDAKRRSPVIEGTPVRLFTHAGLGRYLGRSENTVRGWVSARTGPPTVMIGGETLYRKTDVDEWVESRGAVRGVVAGNGQIVEEFLDGAAGELRRTVHESVNIGSRVAELRLGAPSNGILLRVLFQALEETGLNRPRLTVDIDGVSVEIGSDDLAQ